MERHYSEYGEDVRFLLMTEEEISRLPGEGTINSPDDAFDVVLHDVETGRDYAVKYDWAAYEDCPEEYWTGTLFLSGRTLRLYFYHEHWCGCNRILDISRVHDDTEIVGDDPDENYCPDDRILVRSFTHKALPGLILFTEMAGVVLYFI